MTDWPRPVLRNPASLFPGWPVPDAARDRHRLLRPEDHGAVRQVDGQLAVEHEEDLVGIVVLMPDELALNLDDLELVVVHPPDDLRRPVLGKRPQLLGKAYLLDRHARNRRTPAASRASEFHAGPRSW
jgi:hypothetical protein